VGELFVVVSVFNVFDDNGFLTGVAACEDDDDFSGFDDGHFECYEFCWDSIVDVGERGQGVKCKEVRR
jgi:hypothetical protein